MRRILRKAGDQLRARGTRSPDGSELKAAEIVSGTFRNPTNYIGECGFEDPADGRIGAMLAFADVNAPLYGPGSLGAKPRAGGAPALAGIGTGGARRDFWNGSNEDTGRGVD